MSKSVVFVLGSGISRPSGLPLVEDITAGVMGDIGPGSDTYKNFEHEINISNEICNEDTEKYVKLCQYMIGRIMDDVNSGSGLAAGRRSEILRDRKSRFEKLEVGMYDQSEWRYINRILELDAQGLSVTKAQPANYEDVLSVLQQIEASERGDEYSPMISMYTDSLRNDCDLVDSDRDSISSMLNTVLASMVMIKCVIYRMLRDPLVNIKGLDILKDVCNATWVSKVCVVTFNHDVLVERFLQSVGIAYTTGFLDNSTRSRGEFSPELLLPESVGGHVGSRDVRIIKVHGSIDWRVGYIGEDYNRFKKLISLSEDEMDTRAKAIDGQMSYSTISGLPYILSGGNKEGSYNHKIYGHLQYAFQRWLDNTNTVIVSGFGWNDRGATDRISRWMEGAGNQCLFADERPEDALAFSRWGRGLLIGDADRRGGLVCLSKYLMELSLADIESRIGSGS